MTAIFSLVAVLFSNPLQPRNMVTQRTVVVGAGPVGALAALYAAQRGDEVEVYELRGGTLPFPAVAIGPLLDVSFMIRVPSIPLLYKAALFENAARHEFSAARVMFATSLQFNGETGPSFVFTHSSVILTMKMCRPAGSLDSTAQFHKIHQPCPFRAGYPLHAASKLPRIDRISLE